MKVPRHVGAVLDPRTGWDHYTALRRETLEILMFVYALLVSMATRAVYYGPGDVLFSVLTTLTELFLFP